MGEGKDCSNCIVFINYSGLEERLKNMEGHMENLIKSDGGVIENLWNAIGHKASTAIMIVILTVLMGFIGTLFTLVYQSNQAILTELKLTNKELQEDTNDNGNSNQRQRRSISPNQSTIRSNSSGFNNVVDEERK